ncbi:MAG TPA: tRNA (adenosine(37)-N6)-dimethylallyltransferase MiaA [Clostridiaceae bacterium]|jgi:tRNA dimethylallyltransferase|nr:tRNA (adenosine(37)-N6)-dimethylallyltransferase MiaA [Clostridiaceae bacterium]
MIKAIVITGPTASGKTGISIDLAEKLNGEIVSCDSMQVYKGMDIGTAKPVIEERRGIPHHMLDIVEPYETFDVATYKDMAVCCIKEIANRGRTPILVGGTGLYVNSLVDNIQYVESESDSELRKALYDYAKKHGAEALHAKLKEIDPKAAENIHANNIKRVVRAIELSKLTGMTQEERNALSKSVKSDIEYVVYAVQMDRELLYKRIDERAEKMVEMGLVEEVTGIREKCIEAYLKGISPSPTLSKTALQGIGYKEILEYLDNKCTLEESIDKIKLNTRRYAKRQITWFRKPKWVNWVTIEELKNIYSL